jgi:hypothetical protein
MQILAMINSFQLAEKVLKTYWLSISVILLSTGCKVIKPIEPITPPSQIISTPLPISRIDAPITIDLHQTFQDLDNKLPKNFGQENYVNSYLKYSWYINRNAINPFLNSDGSMIVNDAARWGVEAKGKNPINGQWFHLAGCDADADIILQAKFGLNNDYSLSGNVSKTAFTLGPCNVAVISFPIAPIALNIANQLIDQNLLKFNEGITQYNFRSNFQPFWNTLFNTINLSNIGYLTINPSAIDLGNLTGTGTTIRFDVGLLAEPVISLSKPTDPPVLPIPNLSTISGSGFNVYTDLFLQYPELTSIIQSNVDGKQINYPHGYVLIKEIVLSGQGSDKLIIKLKFKAKYGWICYHGDLYITCKPKYDPQNKTLYLSEINFDAQTKQSLKDKGASWILNSALTVFLGDEIKVPIGKYLDDLKTKLTSGLNQKIAPNAEISGTVSDLEILDMLCAPQYLQIRIKTNGDVGILIK